MKKRWISFFLVIAAVMTAFPVQAAMDIDTAMMENGANRIVSMIMAVPGQDDTMSDDEAAASLQAVMDANMLIQTRFSLAQYLMAMNRVSGRAAGRGIDQSLRLYQDERTASIAVLWQGEQADGTIGSSVQCLTLDLESGREIALDHLFDDVEAAISLMEDIIEEEIMGTISDYMEYADLLPMPREQFSFDEYGLTVYYPQDRYLYFSGRSGAVHFAWHEIDHLIGPDSPVYALSRAVSTDGTVFSQQIASGRLPGKLSFGIGDLMGDATDALTLLCDPDYTTESLVYQFEDEALRGYALEISKYAETNEADTPIWAVRSTRTALCGLITGETDRQSALGQLGEPMQVVSYDDDDAADMLLEPGNSLLYQIEGYALQLHFDEEDLLSAVILREQMPERLL